MCYLKANWSVHRCPNRKKQSSGHCAGIVSYRSSTKLDALPPVVKAAAARFRIALLPIITRPFCRLNLLLMVNNVEGSAAVTVTVPVPLFKITESAASALAILNVTAGLVRYSVEKLPPAAMVCAALPVISILTKHCCLQKRCYPGYPSTLVCHCH